MSTWSSQYRDVRWQKKRLEIMERDEFTCRSCGKKEDVSLNVHHAYYEKNKKPWDYDNKVLITLCEECHEQKHKYQKEILLALADKNIGDVITVLQMVKYSFFTLKCVFEASWSTGIDEHAIQAMIQTLVEVREAALIDCASEKDDE